MTTTAVTPSDTTAGATVRGRERVEHRRPSSARLVSVELRKMFDTRAGFWLSASIVILSVAATAAVIAFAPDADLDYEMFASAVGIPMSVVLPMLTILSITGEWSQRSGLGTFTMVPQRSRVLGAKAAATVVVGVASMAVALGVGALGTLLGSAIAGVDTVWNVTATEFAAIVVANLLGMAMGFMLGVLLRSSPAAIVGYFVVLFVLPPLSGLLAAYQSWWADKQPWFDFQYAQSALYDGWPGGQEWAHVAVSSVPWLLVPLALGLVLVARSEVK